MATKEQERKALEQIEKIIASLGPDSYIGTAMDGMIEDAKENIENDFALSMKDRVETEKKKLAIREGQMDRMAKDLLQTRKEKERALTQLQQVTEERTDLWRRLRETEQTAMENLDSLTVLRDMCKAQEDQILRLKAKLYDFMVKED